MTNLKLITTETFGDLSCNFYRNMNDDILLTREQIGIALEYSDPNVALSKIHKKHKDRLDELSVVTKLESTDGKNITQHYIQKEELWKYVVGQDNQKPTYLWIGYGIL